MIVLHTFGPMFGLPDPSPFVTKTDVLLKLSGVPFTANASGLRGAPKGKLPYIEDDGVRIADSTFIRLHLEQKHGVDFDRELTQTQKGVAWAVEKMLEDHLYWAVMYERWMDDANFRKGPAQFFAPVPAPIRPLVGALVRRSVRKALHGHGLGRHSASEITTLASHAIDALRRVLGDKPYLMGDRPCGADATAFAFVAGVLTSYFESPLRKQAEQHANLVAYRDRMMGEFYPVAPSERG